AARRSEKRPAPLSPLERAIASAPPPEHPGLSATKDLSAEEPGLAPTEAPPAPGKPETAAGAVIEASRYGLQGEAARGGLGKILRARDKRLDRPVAMKELLSSQGQAQNRFWREALLTARLQHPSIIPVYEAGCWPTGEPFYSMKLVRGRPLHEVI